MLPLYWRPNWVSSGHCNRVTAFKLWEMAMSTKFTGSSLLCNTLTLQSVSWSYVWDNRILNVNFQTMRDRVCINIINMEKKSWYLEWVTFQLAKPQFVEVKVVRWLLLSSWVVPTESKCHGIQRQLSSLLSGPVCTHVHRTGPKNLPGNTQDMSSYPSDYWKSPPSKMAFSEYSDSTPCPLGVAVHWYTSPIFFCH